MSGIYSVVNELHFETAFAEIVPICFPRIRVLNFFIKNAFAPISVTGKPSIYCGTVTVSSFPRYFVMVTVFVSVFFLYLNCDASVSFAHIA